MATDARGSALWESLLILLVLMGLASGALITAYLAAGRSWIYFQSEQALYCLSEERPPAVCRERFTRQVKRFLPWGEMSLRLEGEGPFEVRVIWRLGRKFDFALHRRLDLRSSALSRSYPLWSP